MRYLDTFIFLRKARSGHPYCFVERGPDARGHFETGRPAFFVLLEVQMLEFQVYRHPLAHECANALTVATCQAVIGVQLSRDESSNESRR